MKIFNLITVQHLIRVTAISVVITQCPVFAQESELRLEDDNPKKEIDWSKPIVSRGFGYEAQTERDRAYETEYKKAQIAYFFSEYQKAHDIWQVLAEKNHAESQASLGWLYHAGLGVTQDLQRAFELYSRAAEQNNAVAQNNLGVMYENGQHVDKDLEKARALYKLSAENNYRFGQFNYANTLANGLGGKKDRAEAILWYKKAAAQDVEQAKEQLELLNAQ